MNLYTKFNSLNRIALVIILHPLTLPPCYFLADCESIAAGDIVGKVHVIGLVVNDDQEEYWDLVSQWKVFKMTYC